MVLVAGGTGGLGRAVSLAFLKEEARVVVTYRKQQEFDALKNQAGENSFRLEGYSVDVTDEAEAGKLVEGIVSRHGRLDAMVNTVGGYAGGVKLWELGLRPNASVELAFWLCAFERRSKGNAQAEQWGDCKHRGQSCA